MQRNHVSWGQKVTRGPKKFKGAQDVSYRMLILDEKAEQATLHYVGGEYVRCLGKDCPGCKGGHRRSERYGFNVLVYKTDPDTFTVNEPVSYDILPWVASYKVMRSLNELFNVWGHFWNYDLKATCTNKQFQDFQIVNLPDAVWNKVPGLRDTIIKDYQSKAHDIGSSMGRAVSASEMVELMSKSGPNDSPSSQQSSRPARNVSAANDKQLFGGGSQQVSNLVGGVVDQALNQVKSPHILPGSPESKAQPTRGGAEIHGSTAPKSSTPAPFPAPFPAPVSGVDAPPVISVSDSTKPVPQAAVVPSPKFSELVEKLKKLPSK